jgi:glucose-1-phosphate thymidylyltransferase
LRVALKGIILHGGKGTRLRPLTHTGPKQLIPVAGKPISQYVVEDLRDSGIKDIIIVLGNIASERVQEYYGDGSPLGIRITYVQQGEAKGIAHAIKLCESFVNNDDFVVYLGDNLLKGGISEYVKDFEKKKDEVMLLLTRVKDPEHFGVAEFDPSGRLSGVVEKPKYAPSPYIITGIYFFSPIIFSAISKLEPSLRGELEITDAIQILLDSNAKVGYRFVDGWWKDTGTIEDILSANRSILDERLSGVSIEGLVEEGAMVEGRVVIEKGAIIKRGALVRGPCYIGSQTVIGDNAFIGPYTSIGRACRVEGVEIDNSILLDNCEITKIKQRLTDSIVGRFCKIKGDEKRAGIAHFVLGESSMITL